MNTVKELLRQGKKEEIWTKLCGHLDLNIDEYMEIQERLLFEQIDYLKNSVIGKALLGEKVPTTIEEFCNVVPLTTYKDYDPFLKDQKSDVLPFEPYGWARTSGRSGEYPWKWAPYTKQMFDQLGNGSLSAILMSSATRKGEVNIDPHNVLLLGTAPRPYMSGYLSLSVEEQSGFRFVPPLAEGEAMDFGERISAGFQQGMITGLDYFYGLASILAKIGERFETGGGSTKFSAGMLRPSVLLRLIKGFINAKAGKRKLLPKDIWKMKGVLTGGTDTDIFRKKIEYYWGKQPLEGYACTEGGIFAFQSWSYKGMTLLPDSNFYEFIPYEDHIKGRIDSTYKPKTVLFRDLVPGIYEVVFTNLLGGVFTRYRIGDLIEVTSMRDEELEINLPQIRFYSRCDDIIDLAGLIRLTEKSIWLVIEASGVKYVDWIARKEEKDGKPILHLYLELPEGDTTSTSEIEEILRSKFREKHNEFSDFEKMLGEENFVVTRLRDGGFANYMDEQRKAGADLAHIKPTHMQAPEKVIKRLLN
ncbi:MAG TPA: GH3 auxin-responsive promoter family protein [Anaerolineaceae bacterium]|nr:GH3 auxin-responsive promoter family protein [Anaerolineaceae bacterium]